MVSRLQVFTAVGFGGINYTLCVLAADVYVVLESFVVPLGNVSRAAHETLPESEIILTRWSIG